MSPKAIDLQHHITRLAKARERARLAGEYDYKRSESLINLDGGVPAPEYFPFETISSQYLKHDAFPLDPSAAQSSGLLSWITEFFTTPKSVTKELKIQRYATHEDEFDIRRLMSYSPNTGLAPLEKFVREFVGRVHQPAYEDWNTLIDVGAGDALSKALEIVAEPGQGCFVDEWYYNYSLEQMLSIGVTPVPVNIDAVGLDPVDLNNILANWDEEARGIPRPHILIQVPVGQNPAGTTLTPQRKQEIYKVASEWDLIILEDDPYYFQQAGPYVRESVRSATYAAEGSDDEWVKSLVPSFLRYDVDGRVIRFDTFSKTIGPGGRLGYFTTSPLFRRYLGYTQQGRSQAPSGISQALIGTTLHSWGQDGFIRWLRGLRGQYRLRRDWTLDSIYRYFDIEEVFDAGRSVLVVYSRRVLSKEEVPDEKGRLAERKPIFKFVPATGGMFLWFKLYLENHPEFGQLAKAKSLSEARTKIGNQVWQALLDADVLLRPGYVFQTRTEEERDKLGDTAGYLRLSYATVTKEQLELGIKEFARVLSEQFS